MVLLAAFVWMGLPWAASAQVPVELSLDTPRSGDFVGSLDGMVFVSGRALATNSRFERYDVVFVLDRSDSAGESATVDVNGDGRIDSLCGDRSWLMAFFGRLSRRCAAVSDSVFRAELAATRAILAQLDPRTTRVGLVAFGGDRDPGTPDAWNLVPMTTDYARMEHGLRLLEEAGPKGLTNMQAGIESAIQQLVADAPGWSTDAADRTRVMLFFGDGEPTLPRQRRHRYSQVRFAPNIRQNQRLAIEAARRADESAIRIDTYATRLVKASASMTLIELARATDGVFTPVAYPNDLQAWFEEAEFSEIEELSIRNDTSGMAAAYTLRDADGRFSALVPIEAGSNTIQVYARASDGAERRVEARVDVEADLPVPQLDPYLDQLRDRTLMHWLLELREENAVLERERDQEALRRLRIEVDQGGENPERKRAIQVEPNPREPAEESAP